MIPRGVQLTCSRNVNREAASTSDHLVLRPISLVYGGRGRWYRLPDLGGIEALSNPMYEPTRVVCAALDLDWSSCGRIG